MGGSIIVAKRKQSKKKQAEIEIGKGLLRAIATVERVVIYNRREAGRLTIDIYGLAGVDIKDEDTKK